MKDYSHLTREQKIERIRLLEEDKRRYPVKPHPKNFKQQLLAKTFADITFYGGSADSGKTFSIFLLALTQHKRTCIFRQTYPQAREIAEKLTTIVTAAGGTVRQNQTEFRLNGRLIHIRSLPDANAVQGLKGNTYDLMAFDEVSDFPQWYIDFLSTWNRSPDPNQRCRILLTSNPPTGSEGQWLKMMFRDWISSRSEKPKQSGQVAYYVYANNQYFEAPSKDPLQLEIGGKVGTYHPRSYCFIQASSRDNPFSSEEYRQKLSNLPEMMRRAYLEGDWSVMDSDDDNQLFPSAWIELAVLRAKTMPDGLPLHSIGCDVAGSASVEKLVDSNGGAKVDNSAQAHYDGNRIVRVVSVSGNDTKGGEAYTSWVKATMLRYGIDNHPQINVDSIWGGAYEYMSKDEFFAGKVNPVHFGLSVEMVTDDNMLDLHNVKTALYWYFYTRLKPDGPNPIGLPDDPQLIAQLKAIRFSVSGRKIIIEKKIDMRNREGFSPDDAEACIYALAHEIM